LGTVVTTKDCRVPGVIEEVGRLLDVWGWNCCEVNGKLVDGGPGILANDIISFSINRVDGTMSLMYSDDVDLSNVSVPKVGGYKYVAPDIEGMASDLNVAGAAPSESDGYVKDLVYVKMKKSELLDILGNDSRYIKLSKSELIDLIVNRIN
jgi:hypothetical protein